MTNEITPDWIALDWGPKTLRAWAMQGGAVLATARTDVGTELSKYEGIGPALDAVLGDWQILSETPIIACGMRGDWQGTGEIAYRAVPCKPLDGAAADNALIGRYRVHMLPGLRQTTPSDVTDGQETQIAGFLALNKDWDGVICLPGIHTKWVQISAGEVISFQTYMTGEIFALLSEHSVLQDAVGGEEWDAAVFDNGVEEALGKPEKLAARLFAIRADNLLDGTSPEKGRARLLGLLIGAELAASKPYWLGTNIAIIGANEDAQPYARALLTQGAAATMADAERMALAGLTAAYRQVQKV